MTKVGNLTILVLTFAGGSEQSFSAGNVDASQTGAAAGELTEIVVTAGRRDNRLEDTALAVTALDAGKLDAAGIVDTSELQTVAPGLEYGNSGGSNFIYLRGVGNNIYGAFSDNSVATYIDGVYVPLATAAVQELYDVKQVEVLRGPQATLYGRNATGGAILINSQTPSSEPTGSADVQYGNYSAERYRAMLSGPLAAGIDGRVSIVRDAHDGYGTDLTDHSQYDVGQIWAARGSLTAHPVDSAEILLIGDYSKDTGSMGISTKAVNPNSLPFAQPPLGAGTPYSPDPRASYHDIHDTNPQETYGGTLRLTWNGLWAKVTSTSAYHRYLQGPEFLDIDDSIAPLLEYRGVRSSTNFYYEDILFSSPVNQGRFEWLLGGTVLREDTELYNPVLTPAGLDATLSKSQVTAFAGYAQAAFSVSDQLKLVGGIRYSSEHRDGTESTSPPFGTSVPESISRTWTDTSPKGGIEFRPEPGTLIYLTATKGFKSGAFDPSNVTNVVAPETIWSYEAGLKQELLERRLTLNADIFHYDYKNLQLFSGVQEAGTIVTFLQNAGRARIDGLELEPTFAVNRNLQIGTTMALLNARYGHGTVLTDTANSVPAFVPGGTAVVVVKDVGGNQMIQAPRFSGTIFATLTLPVGGGQLDLTASDFYQSSRYYTAFADSTLESKGYDVVNLSTQWHLPGNRWTVGAFVRNLGNTLITGYMSRVPPFGTEVAYAAPRTYGGYVAIHF